MFTKECYIVCSMVYTENDFKETVEAFVRKEFDGIEKMVTSRIALEDIVEHGFEALVKEKEKHIKILVTPKKELLE
jgi:threonine dehydrogenase-like Zn-dependent dehydrogenase